MATTAPLLSRIPALLAAADKAAAIADTFAIGGPPDLSASTSPGRPVAQDVVQRGEQTLGRGVHDCHRFESLRRSGEQQQRPGQRADRHTPARDVPRCDRVRRLAQDIVVLVVEGSASSPTIRPASAWRIGATSRRARAAGLEPAAAGGLATGQRQRRLGRSRSTGSIPRRRAAGATIQHSGGANLLRRCVSPPQGHRVRRQPGLRHALGQRSSRLRHRHGLGRSTE